MEFEEQQTPPPKKQGEFFIMNNNLKYQNQLRPLDKVVDGGKNTIDATTLLSDIKALIKDYFVAKFEDNPAFLKIKLLNRQSFVLTVKEVADI